MNQHLIESAFEPSLLSTLAFETRSFIGRTFLRRPPPDVGSPRLLNLGCGTCRLDGWVNADFYAMRLREPRGYWAVDLRHPLPCRDDHWDGIFSEHALEHLCPRDAVALLRECLRTLRPGAWLRLSVPDLAASVAAYRGEAAVPEPEGWRGPEIIWSLTQHWGHRSVWDGPYLVSVLQELGFADVRRVPYREGTDRRLLVDLPARELGSLYVEARKP